MDFHERKKLRTEYYFKFVYKWKLKECVACRGSGWYDSRDKYGNSISCGACEGTGKERDINPVRRNKLTTVIIDTKRKTIYTDSQGTYDGVKSKVNKIYHKGNIVVTGSGKLKDIQMVSDVIDNQSYSMLELTEKDQKFKLREFEDKGSVIFVVQRIFDEYKYYVCLNENYKTWYGKKKSRTVIQELNEHWTCAYNEYYMTGSGQHYTIPLLVATGSPETTIRVISKIDVNTDDNVNYFCYEGIC